MVFKFKVIVRFFDFLLYIVYCDYIFIGRVVFFEYEYVEGRD